MDEQCVGWLLREECQQVEFRNPLANSFTFCFVVRCSSGLMPMSIRDGSSGHRDLSRRNCKRGIFSNSGSRTIACSFTPIPHLKEIA